MAKELIQLDKVSQELHDFYDEIFIQNRARYKEPSQWLHLWTDFWVALFDMSYTMGHLVAIGLPLYGIYASYNAVAP